jgi:hypothetical protein
MPADRGTTALVAARFRAGAVLAASITQCWQHCLQVNSDNERDFNKLIMSRFVPMQIGMNLRVIS